MVNVRSEGLVRETITKGLPTLEATTVRATLILIEVLVVLAAAVLVPAVAVMSTNYQFNVRRIILFKDLNIL